MEQSQRIGDWSEVIQRDSELNALLNHGIAPLLIRQNDFAAVSRALGFEGVDALADHLGWKTKDDAVRFFTGSVEEVATPEQALTALGRFYRLKQRICGSQLSSAPDSP